MNQFQLWEELHNLFDIDDGSLPEIELTNLKSREIGDIFSFLLSLGKEVRPDGGSFWYGALNRECPIRSVNNAALLVTECEASPFHIVIVGIEVNSTIIPDLGIFFFQESISLDYRKDPQWGPAEIWALFHLLIQTKNLAHDIRIGLWRNEPENMRVKFRNIWNQYLHEFGS
jgi:hypothetical protein